MSPIKAESINETILRTIKVLRYVPFSWFNTIYALDINSEYIHFYIKELIESKNIVIKESVTGSKVLCITKLGFDKVDSFTPTQGKYKKFNEIHINKDEFNTHNFIIFRYLFDYFLNNSSIIKNVITYTDKNAKYYATNSNINNLYNTPDLTIQEQDKIIYLEADTGSESSIILYKKLIKYFYIAYHNVSDYENNSVELYFSFVLKNRENNLFGDIKLNNLNGKVFKYFNQYTNKINVGRDTYISIEMEEIQELIKNNKIQIFVGQAKDGWNNYKLVKETFIIYKE